jgi:hypothetical protein
VLDDIEGRLVDVDHQLSTGGPAVSPFVLPDDLGPLPVELRHRAERALSRTQAKQTEVEGARQRIAEALRQGRTTVREPASYIDTWI